MQQCLEILCLQHGGVTGGTMAKSEMIGPGELLVQGT